jgi:hypothetical protein
MKVAISRIWRYFLLGACLGWGFPLGAEEPPQRGAALYTFTFPGAPRGSGETHAQPDAVPEGLEISRFQRSGARESRGKDVFNSRGWKAAGSADPGFWVGCTVNVRPGHTLRLSQVKFWAKGSDKVPGSFGIELEIRRKGGAVEHLVLPVIPVSVQGDMVTCVLDAIILRGGDSVTIRWHVFGTKAADTHTAPKAVGTFQLDAVTFFGEIDKE